MWSSPTIGRQFFYGRWWVARTCAALLLWIVLATRVSAQTSFAGGGLLFSWQPDNSPYVGTQNPSVPQQGIHGSAFGWSATAGVFPSPRIGLAVELSVPTRFTAEQVAAKYRTRNTHRDVVVSGVLHVRASRRLVAVVGASDVHEETDQQIAYRVFSSPEQEYGPFGPAVAIARHTFGVVGGIDVPISLRTHLRLTPQLRVHWIARENDDTAPSPRFLGLSSVVWRPACGVAVTF
jgi:hypothetical protein